MVSSPGQPISEEEALHNGLRAAKWHRGAPAVSMQKPTGGRTRISFSALKFEEVQKAVELMNEMRTAGSDRSHSVEYFFSKRLVGARERARKRGLPMQIDKDFLLQLYAEQNERCAITRERFSLRENSPFNISLDRITPSLGYVPGNVRIVCNYINQAMNQWGEGALYEIYCALRIRFHEDRCK